MTRPADPDRDRPCGQSRRDCTRGQSIEARFFHAQRLRICASYLADKSPNYFRLRCAKTADFAFPTLAASGRAGSKVRPCWKPRP